MNELHELPLTLYRDREVSCCFVLWHCQMFYVLEAEPPHKRRDYMQQTWWKMTDAKSEWFVLCFSNLTHLPDLVFHISIGLLGLKLCYQLLLSLTGCRNSLFKTNYLWPTLWSSSLKSAGLAQCVTLLWQRIVIIFATGVWIFFLFFFLFTVHLRDVISLW